jgi:hypothetical protein
MIFLALRKRLMAAETKITLFYDDFQVYAPGTPKSVYEYASDPALGLPLADDAAGGVSSGAEGLEIRSTPFTFSTGLSGLDHTKYFVTVKKLFQLDAPGETVFEGIVSAQQTGLELLPPIFDGDVTNAQSDIRLAVGGFVLNDPDNNMVYDIGITNETIYAYYERLPFGRVEWGGDQPPYQTTSHAIPIGKRNVADPINDYVKVAIAVNFRDNYVRWLLNDVEVYRITRIGFPLDRQYRILENDVVVDGHLVTPPVSLQRSTEVKFGFGTFSLMDAYDRPKANNRGLVNVTQSTGLPYSNPQETTTLGQPLPAEYVTGYPIPGETGSNFGQGCILRLKYITAYRRGIFPDLKGECCQCILWTRCEQNELSGVNARSTVVKSKCHGKIKPVGCSK